MAFMLGSSLSANKAMKELGTLFLNLKGDDCGVSSVHERSPFYKLSIRYYCFSSLLSLMATELLIMCSCLSHLSEKKKTLKSECTKQ